MKIQKILRSLFLSAGLGITPSFAQEFASPDISSPEPTLISSDETLSHLQSIKDIFLKIAGMDVLVISPADLMDAEQQKRALILERMGVSKGDTIPKDGLLTSMIKITDPIIKWGDNNVMHQILNLTWGMAIVNDQPFSTLSEQKDGSKICVIGGLDPDMAAVSMIAKLAQLPAEFVASLKISISEEDLYQFVMIHEARHCQHDRKLDEDSIQRTVAGLENEINSDQVAFDFLREKYKSDPEYFEKISKDLKAARTIGTIRSALSISEGAPGFISHGGTFSIDNEDTPDPAELILSAGILNMSHLIIGVVLEPMLSSSNDPVLKEYYKDKEFSFDPEKFGRLITSRYPMFEYAHFRALSNFLEQSDYNNVLLENPQTASTISLMNDYIRAFEHLVPNAPQDPIVKTYESLVSDMIDKVKDQMPKTTSNYARQRQFEPPVPAMSVLDVLKLAEEKRLEGIRLRKGTLETWLKQQGELNLPESKPAP